MEIALTCRAQVSAGGPRQRKVVAKGENEDCDQGHALLVSLQLDTSQGTDHDTHCESSREP